MEYDADTNEFIVTDTENVIAPEEVNDQPLTAEQKEVKVVLAEISRLAAIKFVYSSQRIPAHQKVSLQARDRRVSGGAPPRSRPAPW